MLVCEPMYGSWRSKSGMILLRGVDHFKSRCSAVSSMSMPAAAATKALVVLTASRVSRPLLSGKEIERYHSPNMGCQLDERF
jgi:hypothetical protein